VSTGSEDGGPQRVAARLASLQGVRDVDVSDLPDSVSVRLDIPGLRALSESAIRGILSTELGLDTDVRAEVVGLLPATAGTRARFESLQLAVEEPGRVTARVTLDWNGTRHVGEASAEASPAGELRASAAATIDTLEQVIGDSSVFSLIGIKELYVFDHHVVAVLLYSPRLPSRRLIGLSIISQDRQTSAVIAVLNATNRALGSLRDVAD
jgi:hypothetical protein